MSNNMHGKMIESKLIQQTGYLRLPQVLQLIPVSKSTWWQGVREGRFPSSVKLGPRTTVWRVTDILSLIERGVK